MQKSDCFSLGKITKPHALKGEVIIYLDVDVPEYYAKLDAIWLEINSQLVPFIIEKIQIKGKKSILKLEEIDTIEATEKIINAEVFLPLNKLPKLKGKQFYYHEVIGYGIINHTTKEVIGTITSIYESTGQDLFAISIQDKEVLLPIVDDFIIKLDHENQTIEVMFPDGLIDLYLS